jgi:6-phosphogluconate dehydrogenase (decarboxylating)
LKRKLLDEFDEAAKRMIEEEKYGEIKNVLRNFAIEEAYEHDKELRDPLRFLKTSGIDVYNIKDFTEYRVAKSVIKTEIKRQFGSRYFDKLKKKVQSE